MEEYREIVKLGPVLLDRASLTELERVLCQDLTPQPDSLRIRLADGARVVEANSIEQLFRSQLPASTNSVSMDITSWNQQRQIDTGVSLGLHQHFADYHIHALSETLYLGKKAQLDGFFRRHRPWYAIINTLLPMVGPALSLSALFAAALLARQGAIAAAVLSVSLGVVSAIMVWLGITGRVFPLCPSATRRPDEWALALGSDDPAVGDHSPHCDHSEHSAAVGEDDSEMSRPTIDCSFRSAARPAAVPQR